MARRTHSTLDDPEVKSLVQAMLAAGKTYDEIVAEVLRQTGRRVTRSAISRGKLRWESAAQQMEALRREAQVLEQVAKDNPADLSGATTALFQTKIFERLKNVHEAFDDADILELGNLQVKITRTRLMQEALKIQQDRLNLLREKVQTAAEKIDAIGRAKSLDEETLKKIREEVYGLAPEAAA